MHSRSLWLGFDIPRRISEIQRRVVTIPGISYIVIVVPGWLVTQVSHARFTCVLRSWRLQLRFGGKERKIFPFYLKYSNISIEKGQSSLPSERTTGLYIEDLACVKKHFTCLTKRFSFVHPDEFASSALPGGALFRNCSLKEPLGKTKKGAQCYPLLKFLIDLPCFRTAVTTCNFTSGSVLSLFFLFL